MLQQAHSLFYWKVYQQFFHHHLPTPPNTGFEVYAHINCKSFLYLGEHVYEKQCWISQPLKDGSKMEIVFQRKRYCTEIQPSKWFSKKQWPRRQFTENPSWHTAVGISDWNKNEEGRKCGWRQMGNRYKIYNNNLIFGFMLVPYDSENKTFQCMGDKMTIQVILISILKIASRPLNASF